MQKVNHWRGVLSIYPCFYVSTYTLAPMSAPGQRGAPGDKLVVKVRGFYQKKLELELARA